MPQPSWITEGVRIGPTVIVPLREAFGGAWDGAPPSEVVTLRVTQINATTITVNAEPEIEP
jgi:hypothetical protein